jgi:hypothetical protein
MYSARKIGLFVILSILQLQFVSAAELIVTAATDSGAGSLRQAIADASAGDTILFDEALNGSVITLTSGELLLDKPISIVGPGPDLLTIDGNASSSIFNMEQASFPTAGTYSFWISGLTVSNGVTSSGGGGGIRAHISDYQWRFNLTVSNCVVTSNLSTGNIGGGGILASRHVIFKLIDSDIRNNRSTENGGGVWIGFDALIERCLFYDNETDTSGGGIFIREHGITDIRNCTISGNTSTYSGWNTASIGGGGVLCYGTAANILNSTICNNHARMGGGLRTHEDKVVLNVVSSIIADNTDVLGQPDIFGRNGAVSITNSLVLVTNNVEFVGTDNIFDQPPMLEPLADNGGLTLTHALHRKSPAIDKGINIVGLTTDQRGEGFPRVLGDGVDIGAYEFMPPSSGTMLYIR